LRRAAGARYDVSAVRWTFIDLLVVLITACAAAPPRSDDTPAPSGIPADAERHYAIWLGGAQVGTARETEQWSHAGVILRRTEAMQFLRGAVPVALATTIEITADRQLVPSRVTWTEAARAIRRGEAVRDAAGWLVTDEAGVRRLPPGAIPAELAPLLVRRDGRFAGPVFLPARGFVAGTGWIDPVAPAAPAAPRRFIARLVLEPGVATGAATLRPGAASIANPPEATPEATPDAATEATAEATIDLGDDAMPVRTVDGEGVIATRVTAAEAAIPFAPVDLIAATSIPLTGPPSHRLVLAGDLAVPAVPGQAVHAAAEGALLELSARFHGGLPPGPAGEDRTREIIALVDGVHHRITPDLGAHPTSARAAAAAAAGDCTTFALAYAALATARAIPTRVVTGFRVDAARLVRHRWAVSWTGRAWIAVDAAFGAAPAGGNLVGLAVHDADDAGLVAGEAALTHVRAAAWR
jgi:transglutaminase superfamily protein